MHFLVTWNIKSSDVTKVTLDFVSGFSGTKFAYLMENTFVVGVDSAEEYIKIRDRLGAIAETAEKSGAAEKIGLVISPPSSGGKYTGWLPAERWPDANRLSEGESNA